MSADQIRPELRKAIAGLPTLPFHIRPLLPLARFVFNLASRSPLPDHVEARDEIVGHLKVRVFSPKSGQSDAAVLWCFGGGHVAGKAAHVNRIAGEIAERTGATVFAPHYRIAPEHPFPGDLDDCFACWRHMVENAQTYAINPDRLAIGGHSAGGGLAAALSQRVLDDGGIQPRAQILFYPMLDDRTAADTSKDALETFVWSNRANRVAWSAYLAPNSPGANTLPDYAAPARRADLKGLPPAWIGYGDIDLFSEEIAQYADRLTSAGVECDVTKVSGAPHAFEAICPDAAISKSFVDAAMGFLAEKLE